MLFMSFALAGLAWLLALSAPLFLELNSHSILKRAVSKFVMVWLIAGACGLTVFAAIVWWAILIQEAPVTIGAADGLVPIETISGGDLVMAYDEATGKVEAKPVTDLIRPEPKETFLLAMTDAQGERETF